MKNILIAGGTGLIGTHLSQLLKSKGHTVAHLSRRANPSAEFPTYAWQPEKGIFDKKAFDEADAIINLAGASIADKLWSKKRKQEIIFSRTAGNTLIAQYLRSNSHHVKTYISASAIGFYDDRGDDMMTETSSVGTGFLAESTMAWENAIAEVAATGVRTVALRIGVVLSPEGGALQKMLIPFWFRLGVYFGNGQQWVSWIHRMDLCNLFVWALENQNAQGTFNAVAPTPLSNLNLTKAISMARGGFYLSVPAPSFILRLVMGEMADVVLGSTRVSCRKLENQGFVFQFPNALEALKDLI
ncbi:MAG: TIGR01777 family oxidoreductase [Saprospiraceae bacterium]|nr:TIGR01777 family oxidoreductase [Saprospiraceae bacterium]